MPVTHLHTPEMKAKARDARIQIDGGPRPPIVRSGPNGGMTVKDRMLSAKRRYEYWLARYELSVKKETERAEKANRAAAATIAVAEQRAIVKHNMENRIGNMEAALSLILERLSTNGKA